MSKVPGGVITFGVLDILFAFVVFLGGIGSLLLVSILLSAVNSSVGGGLGGGLGAITGGVGVVSSLGMVSVLFYSAIAIIIFFAVFLFITSIGILKMKNWARVTMIALSGIFMAFSAMGLIGCFISAAGQGFPIVELIIFLLLLIVPVWQIDYFTRPEMKNRFS
jgi:hypothetical protein